MSTAPLTPSPVVSPDVTSPTRSFSPAGTAEHPLKGEVICVDGPSASGKGTLAKALARAYRMKFLDTGCLYRAVGYLLLQDGVAEDELDAAVRYAEKLAQPGFFDFRHKGDNVFGVWVDGVEVSEDIRTLAVGLRANIIAQHMPLRLALRDFQQAFVAQWQPVYGVVLDGRDTGAKIAPQARLKLMMTGDPAVRAQWRMKEYVAAGKVATLAEVVADLTARDARDAANMETFAETVKVDVTATDAAGVLATVMTLVAEQLGARPVGTRG